jgi:hypothetical protein
LYGDAVWRIGDDKMIHSVFKLDSLVEFSSLADASSGRQHDLVTDEITTTTMFLICFRVTVDNHSNPGIKIPKTSTTSFKVDIFQILVIFVQIWTQFPTKAEIRKNFIAILNLFFAELTPR